MLSQISVACRINALSFKNRLVPAVMSVASIACVVAVTIAIFSVYASYSTMLNAGIDEKNLLIMSAGAEIESASNIPPDVIDALSNSGLLAGVRNHALSQELLKNLSISRKKDGEFVSVTLRGITAEALQFRPQLAIVQGRTITPGTFELIVGASAQSEFNGLNLGDTITIGDAAWNVVGIFENNNGASESEVWGDISSVQSVFDSQNQVSSVRTHVAPSATREELEMYLATLPQNGVFVQQETDYVTRASEEILTLLQTLGLPLITLMSLGAFFASLLAMVNTMSIRGKEFATLRAIGYQRFPLATSVLIEAAILALFGGLIGSCVMYLLLDGVTADSNFMSDSQFIFQFEITQSLITFSVALAGFIGVAAGILPATQAVNKPLTSELK